MKPTLRVFIAQHCPSCAEAVGIANSIQENYAQSLNVEIIDIADKQAQIPEKVFATPTFMLNDRIVSLGNPGPRDIATWVEKNRS